MNAGEYDFFNTGDQENENSPMDQLSECQDQLLRIRAEIDNQRKRLKKEIDNAYHYAIQEFVTRILPVKDSLEKGIDVAYVDESIDGETLLQGMISTLNMCNNAFKATGIEEIDPLGKEFDPELHEAVKVTQVKNERPNKIIGVYQKGYLLHDRLIRPARVDVSG